MATVINAGWIGLGWPEAGYGNLRSLLTSLVPQRAVARALSTVSMLTSGIWAVSPAAVTGLALGVAPRTPLLLAAALMAVSVAGLWLLPVGWDTDAADDDADVLRGAGRADTDGGRDGGGAGRGGHAAGGRDAHPQPGPA
jgi:hypothetical protein